MKNKIIITILLASLQLATSCSKWLDVQPETEKDRAELIKTENGYKQMLYGTYINLTSSSLYGDNLTYGVISGLARDYVYRISYNTALPDKCHPSSFKAQSCMCFLHFLRD